jgi:hypothetical protein
MRKVVLVALFGVACGGSSSSSGGGVSGTVGGRPFTPVDARAIMASTGTGGCTLPVPGGGGSLSFGVSAVAITFASYANVCGDFSSSQCTVHANAQNVTVLHARLATGTAPALRPGTFTIHATPSTVTPDVATGNLVVAFAQALSTGAAPTCIGTASPSVEGGTLEIREVSGTRIAGHLNVTFQDGSAAQGDFSADACSGVSPDICGLATAGALCQGAPVCQL